MTGATVNVGGRIVVRATRVGADTALAQIGALVTRAQSGKAPVQRLADRVAAIFVPVVIAIAVATLGFWIGAGETGVAFAAAVVGADHRLPLRARPRDADGAARRHRARRAARPAHQGSGDPRVDAPRRHDRARQDRHADEGPDVAAARRRRRRRGRGARAGARRRARARLRAPDRARDRDRRRASAGELATVERLRQRPRARRARRRRRPRGRRRPAGVRRDGARGEHAARQRRGGERRPASGAARAAARRRGRGGATARRAARSPVAARPLWTRPSRRRSSAPAPRPRPRA